ncbi:MAG TPA: DUF559 domain-containing protein [Allosphingosinicella sp.]
MVRPKRSIDRNESVMRARALRRTPTLPEILLWQALRQRPGDFKFRHQHPLGLTRPTSIALLRNW